MSWLLLLPLLFGLVLAELRSRRQLRRLLADGSPALGSGRRLFPDLLTLTALGLLLVTLPTADGRQLTDEPLSIALVVDVSQSMQVDDVLPDRLGLARRELGSLLGAAPAATRFLLIPFAGEAVVQVPQTVDRGGLGFFIDTLHAGMIASPGSAPEEAVALAQRSLQTADGQRLIVLLGDGERTIADAPPSLVQTVPVYPLVTGTDSGGPVANHPEATSRADRERMRSIAVATGGRLITSIAELPLPSSVSGASATMALSPLLALTLLLLRFAAPLLRARHGGRQAALLLVILAAGCLPSGDATHSGEAQFSRALRAAHSGEVETALSGFAAAQRQLDGVRRGMTLYNRGTLLLQQDEPAAAVPLLEQALLLMPGDAPARDNLLLALARRQAAPGSGQGTAEQESDNGEQLAPEQARHLVDSVRLDPTAPPIEAAIRPPTVLKEW